MEVDLIKVVGPRQMAAIVNMVEAGVISRHGGIQVMRECARLNMEDMIRWVLSQHESNDYHHYENHNERPRHLPYALGNA